MSEPVQILFGLLGGLAIFLYGMTMMSDNLQRAAGEKMKKILGMLKEKRFMTFGHENMILIAPPLIITAEQIREEMQKVDEVLSVVDREMI